ncbi:hypothetical protein [Streptomyces termitum]|uniref:hypothetical protein n=1 Tax=Streptomyces termitum TaxID=67368 RepID=UPI0033BABE7D
MLTFDDVYQAPLGRLKDAVDRWAEMKSKLDVLAEDARRTMVRQTRAEDWRGLNAEVTKPFIDKTAKEFEDAAKAAEGIHKVLADGHRTFRKAQDDLKRIVDVDAPGQGLVVKSGGTVEARYPVWEDHGVPRDADFQLARRKEQAKIEALQRRIDAIVENCDDADVSCSNALRANNTSDAYNFSAPKYTSLDAEEADRAIELAGKGRKLTHEELAQLNELLADNQKSRDFSRVFYDRLGPKGALEFFGEMTGDTYGKGSEEKDKERLADIQALQKNLGLNLANATQSNGEWAKEWSAELRRLGTERVQLPSRSDTVGPYGYQLLGGLLRYGDYDKKFLVPIAEHVTQLHAKEPDLFKPEPLLRGAWDRSTYNPSGTNGYGYDPVIPVLEALGHSPEAAKEFFSATPTSYERDGSVGGTLELGKSKYLDYFADEKYPSFADHYGKGAEGAKDYMPDALGHALEAATLGHAWDDPRPELRRDEVTAGIMEDVVDKYGDAEFVKKHQSALADSLGNMGAGYIDDLSWALSNKESASVYAPDVEGKSLKDTADITERHLKADRGATIKFLSVLGQYPDAYASMSTADRLYTVSMLEAQVGADGRIDEAGAREVARTGAHLQGALDESRGKQIEAEGAKAIEDYEKAQEERGAWVELGVGTAIAAGVAFIPPVTAAAGAAAILVPLAVDTASGAMETLAGVVIGDWSEKSVEDYKDATEDKVGEDREAVYGAGRHSAESPVENFVRERGAQVSGDLKQDLIEAVDIGYAKGNSLVGQIGNGPETE